MYRLLAADDDSSMTDFYRDLFSSAGYDVQTAGDAGEAMELFYDFKPDLMVLDADMPGGGGERVFLTARTVLDSGTPIIFVTGLPRRVIDFALAHDMVRVFAKPVKSDDLLTAVKDLLRL